MAEPKGTTRFAFTDFECDHDYWETFYEKNNVKYIYYGEEETKTDRKHFQGYIVFNEKRTLGQAIKLVEPRHVEFAKKNEIANLRYCGKEGRVRVIGDAPAQGKRTDLKECQRLLLEGMTFAELSLKFPQQYMMYHRAFDRFADMHGLNPYPQRDWVTEVLIFQGKSGKGKTHKAIKEMGAVPVWISGNPTDPFVRGYHGQEKVVINEFNEHSCTLEWLLELTDKYAFNINVKGGERSWYPKTIIFTTNTDARKWYKYAPKEQREAWNRRITRIETFE